MKFHLPEALAETARRECPAPSLADSVRACIARWDTRPPAPELACLTEACQAALTELEAWEQDPDPTDPANVVIEQLRAALAQAHPPTRGPR